MQKSTASTTSSDVKQSKQLKKQRTCQVYLLNGQEFRCDVPRKANGSDLLKQIYELLNIVECDYFGLCFKDLSEQKYWLETNKSIKKQLKNGPWSFYFALKFYPPDPSQLREDITRYYIVLQLREDIVTGRLPCSFVTHALLGSYVVQSELGDYDRSNMRGNYVKDFTFAPNQTTELEEKIVELHKTHKGQTPEQAEMNFLENAKKLPLYGVDMHLAHDIEKIEVWLGVSWNGVLVFRDGALINRFSWPRIIKLSYIRSKFYVTIRPLDGELEMTMIGFKMSNHRAAKNTWKSGVEHHAFFRLTHCIPTPPRSQLVRVGSKFRYSGRTQQEVKQATIECERPAPTFVRTNSRRHRSDTNEALPTRAVLHSVREEVTAESPSPPPLPAKANAKVSRVVEETLTTTEIIENAVQPPGEEEEEEERTRKSSTSSDEEFLEDKHDDDEEMIGMTDHQKMIHKRKKTGNEGVEFLTSPSPRPASSVDSLDAIDARLTPRKSKQSRTPTKPSEDSSLRSEEDVSNVITETTTVVTYEEIVKNYEVEKSPPLENEDKTDDQDHYVKLSSSSDESYRRLSSQEPEEFVNKPPADIDASSESSSSDDEQKQDVEDSFQNDTLIVTSSSEDESPIVMPDDVTINNEVNVETFVKETDDPSMTQQLPTIDKDEINGEPDPTDAHSTTSSQLETTQAQNEAETVRTELKTVTYEQSHPMVTRKDNISEPQLISSQIISSETEHAITTTEITKTMHGSICETKVEKHITASGGGDIDHNQAMIEMIRDTQRNNPNISVTKVVVHEERPVMNNNHTS